MTGDLNLTNVFGSGFLICNIYEQFNFYANKLLKFGMKIL